MEKIGKVITVIDSLPYQFLIDFEDLDLGTDDPFNQWVNLYKFRDLKILKSAIPINFNVRVSSNVISYYDRNKKALHDYSIKFALFQIKQQPNLNTFDVISEYIDAINEEPRISGQPLKTEIRNFIYNVNSFLPQLEVNIEDLNSNINAEAHEIKQWAQHLVEEGTLIKSTKPVKIRYKEGEMQLDHYRIKPDKLEEISNILKDNLSLKYFAQQKLENKGMNAGIPPSTTKSTESIKSDGEISAIPKAIVNAFGLSKDDENPPDALDYEDYAKAIASIITHEKTQTPLTIGVCAPWGRGKTVLLSYIKRAIKSENKSDTINFNCIDFNAWEYSKADKLWSAFSAEIVDGIIKKLNRRMRFKFRMNYLNKAYPRLSKLSKVLFVISLIMLLGQLALTNLLPHVYLNLYVSFNILFSRIYYFITALLAAPIISIIVGYFVPITKHLFMKPLSLLLKKDLFYYQNILNRLTIVSNWLNRFMPSLRVVTFIDDLDRCNPKGILGILEAIKFMLKIENFIFILAMDTKVLRFAIGDNYKFMCDSQDERERMGRNYLEKIIQIPFRLPELNSIQRKELSNNIINQYMQNVIIKPMPATAAAGTSGPDNLNSTRGFEKEVNNLEIEDDKNKSMEHQKEEIQKAKKKWLYAKEKELIDSILSIDEFDLSPRLLKRFINIYLIARNIFILKQSKISRDKEGDIPDPSFTKWLALSVLLPFETRALIKWWELNDWKDPLSDNEIFKDSKFNCLEPGKDRTPKKGTPFECININSLDKFAKLYLILEIDHNVVKENRNITGCFNLVLD